MARVELSNILKASLYPYLGIPYYKNSLKHLGPKDNAHVGKGTATEIAQATIATASEQKIDLLGFTPKQMYQFQKKNHLGIDCSGLVYHLLNQLYQHLFDQDIEPHLIGTEGKTGPRRVSANLLTSPANSFPVQSYDDIKTGDLIRLDRGHHVILIIEKVGQVISYVHSSDRTQIRGVHLGTITLIHPDLPLNHQLWSDRTTTGKPYSELFYPDSGDGLFRLKCFAPKLAL
jgi:hypothetical protein